MSHREASVKSILFAFLANLGIAITKTIAAVITGSGAMLAESIHSFADCGNQALLFLGMRSTEKKPDPKHPLGYGKEIFFWSFIVALILFSMGGVFSIYEGVHKLHSHEELNNPIIAIYVLILSMLFESASLYGCLNQIKKLRHNTKLWKWTKNSRQSELVVILGEDIAALAGLSLALISVILSMITGNSFYDAAGSIGIGVLLVAVSIFLAVKVKSLLIGQSADNETIDEIQTFLQSRPEIDEVLNLITFQLGPKIMVAIKARMRKTETTEEMIYHINACEKELKGKITSIQWVFFEPDIDK